MHMQKLNELPPSALADLAKEVLTQIAKRRDRSGGESLQPMSLVRIQQKIIRQAGQGLGLQNVGWHSFRHVPLSADALGLLLVFVKS